MTAENFVAALRAFSHRRPFQPFMIEFITGERLLVKHPELVELREKLVHYMDPHRRHRLFDSASVSQVMDVLPP